MSYKYTDYWAKSKIVARAVMEHKPEMVLDVGCGEGQIVKLLIDEGVQAYGLDNDPHNRILEFGKYAPKYCGVGDARNIPFPDKMFDVVVSNDFFEHIAEEDVSKVYSEMRRVGIHVIARISLKEKDSHLTVKPMSWWKEKLPGCQFIGKDWNR